MVSKGRRWWELSKSSPAGSVHPGGAPEGFYMRQCVFLRFFVTFFAPCPPPPCALGSCIAVGRAFNTPQLALGARKQLFPRECLPGLGPTGTQSKPKAPPRGYTKRSLCNPGVESLTPFSHPCLMVDHTFYSFIWNIRHRFFFKAKILKKNLKAFRPTILGLFFKVLRIFFKNNAGWNLRRFIVMTGLYVLKKEKKRYPQK